MRTVARNARVRRGPEVLHRVLEGEALLVDLASGRFFGLDPVGTFVWEGIEEEVPVADLVERVTAEFRVDAGRAERDLLALLGDLARRGLVEVRPAAR